jgi:hypothetical protein
MKKKTTPKAKKKAAPKAKTAPKKKTAAKAAADPKVFGRLRKILARHAAELVVVKDEEGYYYVDTKKRMSNKKPVFFGSVRAGKAYTSFHLMPVYTNPRLLMGASAELRARMQGKSCFNFKRDEPELFDELAALTERSFEAWNDAGMI